VEFVQQLAAAIDRLHPQRRALVASDGPDAAGKTSMAHRLADALTRPVVTASIDGWHNERSVRMRRGTDSPEGYYLDSFDYDALTAELLEPFAGGAATVRTARFDYRSDAAMSAHEVDVAATAVLVFDGVFLLRPRLRPYWDLTVYLHVPEHVILERAIERDVPQLGTPQEVRSRYELRYLPGQALYQVEVRPQDQADILVDATDPDTPRVVRWQGDR
jgi:uridine kinase